MSRVAVVTDSAACLRAGTAREHGIRVVPLQVVLGGRSLADGEDVTAADVARELRAGAPVTTSRPAPAVFARAYRELAEGGSDAVVSVHLSGELSGTCEAARLAAREVADVVPVTVVDSRCLGMGLGFAAMAAATRARRGAEVAEVVHAAAWTAANTRTWVYVDTLEHLRAGGRIGAASAWLGSALAVKPILALVDGRLEPVERVRTASKALARLHDLIVADVGQEAVRLAVHHLAAGERAATVAESLVGALPSGFAPEISEVGAVLGAHVGPGMIAVVASPVHPG